MLNIPRIPTGDSLGEASTCLLDTTFFSPLSRSSHFWAFPRMQSQENSLTLGSIRSQRAQGPLSILVSGSRIADSCGVGRSHFQDLLPLMVHAMVSPISHLFNRAVGRKDEPKCAMGMNGYNGYK